MITYRILCRKDISFYKAGQIFTPDSEYFAKVATFKRGDTTWISHWRYSANPPLSGE